MPERFEIYIVYKRRYINTLPFLPFLTTSEGVLVQEVRLVVDRCESAVIVESETGHTSSQDRRPCEVVSRTPGHATFVSVNAPLELGGRSSLKVTKVKDTIHPRQRQRASPAWRKVKLQGQVPGQRHS